VQNLGSRTESPLVGELKWWHQRLDAQAQPLANLALPRLCRHSLQPNQLARGRPLSALLSPTPLLTPVSPAASGWGTLLPPRRGVALAGQGGDLHAGGEMR